MGLLADGSSPLPLCGSTPTQPSRSWPASLAFLGLCRDSPVGYLWLGSHVRLLGPDPYYRLWLWAGILRPLDLGGRDFSPLISCEKGVPNLVGLHRGYCFLSYMVKNLPCPWVLRRSLFPDGSGHLDTHINSANFTFPSLRQGWQEFFNWDRYLI